MSSESTGPTSQPRLAAIGQLRSGLLPDHLRRLGVPQTLMSDFEFAGAIFRDSQYDGHAQALEIMGGYDRRGLLNVIAYLAQSFTPSAGLPRCALCHEPFEAPKDLNSLTAQAERPVRPWIHARHLDGDQP